MQDDVLIAGEGIETMLSLREVLPTMPMAAATSSAHLAAILFPPTLQRLYVARDRDAAGDAAFGILTDRAQAAGIELVSLMPDLADFNDDLRQHGASGWASGSAFSCMSRIGRAFRRLRLSRYGVGGSGPGGAHHPGARFRTQPGLLRWRPRDRLPGGRNGGHAAIFRRRAKRAPFHREPK
jgi:hypothetical protein